MSFGLRIATFIACSGVFGGEDPIVETVVMDPEVTVIDYCPRCKQTRSYVPRTIPFSVLCGGCGKLAIMVPL